MKTLPAIALACIGSLLLAGCGGSGSGSADPPRTPRERVEAVGFPGVRNGEVEVDLRIRAGGSVPGGGREGIKMRVGGEFIAPPESSLPQLDLVFASHGQLSGRQVDFDSGLTVVPGQIVVNYDQKTFQPQQPSLASGLSEAEGEGGPGDWTACRQAAAEVSLADLIASPTEGRNRELDGSTSIVVGGEVDVEAAIEALATVAEDPGCGAQLQALAPDLVGKLEENKAALADATREARATFSFYENGVLRKFAFNWQIEPNQVVPTWMHVYLYLRLERVNEVPSLPAPGGTSPFGALLQDFGVDPDAIEGASSDEVLSGFLAALGAEMVGHSGG